jgi:hypothetical protein
MVTLRQPNGKLKRHWAGILDRQQSFGCFLNAVTALALSITIAPAEDPIIDPDLPGYLRVRFIEGVPSDEADAILQAGHWKLVAKSGTLASPQWRRIQIQPFTEDIVSEQLKANPKITQVRNVKFSEIYFRDRGVSLQTVVTQMVSQPIRGTELRTSSAAYIDQIRTKLIARFGDTFKEERSDEISLTWHVKLDGIITKNPRSREVVDCTIVIADSQLFLVADGIHYDKRYDPAPPAEVIKPFAGEFRPAFSDFAAGLLELARSALPTPLSP